MMFKRSGFGHNAVMLRKSVYDEFLYEPEFEYCEDYRLWTKIAANSDFKFHNLQEVLVDYRIHSTQVISTKQSIQKKLRNDILRDFLIDLGMNFSEEEFFLYQKLRELQTNFDKREANILGRFMFRLKSVTQEKFPDSYGVYDGYLNVLKDSLGTVTC